MTCFVHGRYPGYSTCPHCEEEYDLRLKKNLAKKLWTPPVKEMMEGNEMATPTETPMTRMEKFKQAAKEMKEKNKKMQRAVKKLKKDPELENLLEEISKFQF